MEIIDKLSSAWGGDIAWMLQAFVVVLLTLILGAVVRRILKRLAKRAHETDNMFDDVLLEALTGPSRGLVWVLGVSFAGGTSSLPGEECPCDSAWFPAGAET